MHVRIQVGLAAAAVLAAGCSGGGGPSASATPASIQFSSASVSIALRGELQLAPIVRDSDGQQLAGTGLTWLSSDPELASVDADGKVRGHSLGGPVSISARGGSAEAAVSVTVIPASVTISPAVAALAVGSQANVAITMLDALGGTIPHGSATWSSDAPTIASIDEFGTIRALAVGTTTLRAVVDGFSTSAGLYVGVPKTYDGQYVSTDDPRMDAQLTIFLGRVTGFTAVFRASTDCRFDFGAAPNTPIAIGSFSFQLGNWATSVNGTLVSDSVITGGINGIPAASLSPGCLVHYGLSNRENLNSQNVTVSGFILRRP